MVSPIKVRRELEQSDTCPNVASAAGRMIHAPQLTRAGVRTGEPLCTCRMTFVRYTDAEVTCPACLAIQERAAAAQADLMPAAPDRGRAPC